MMMHSVFLNSSMRLLKDDSEYLGYKLVDLIRHKMARLFREKALDSVDYLLTVEFAKEGLKIAPSNSEKLKLLQIIVAANIRMKNFEEAINVLVTILKSDIPINMKIEDYLLVSLKKYAILLTTGDEGVQLNTGARQAIRQIAEQFVTKGIFEKRAADLEQKVLAGDLDAAREVFTALYFTQSSLDLAALISWKVLSGEATEEMKQSLTMAYSTFPVSTCPEIVLVKALALKEEYPSLADKYANDILKYYGNKPLVCKQAGKSISFYAKKLLSGNEVAKITTSPEISKGVVEVWKYTCENNQVNMGTPLAAMGFNGRYYSNPGSAESYLLQC